MSEYHIRDWSRLAELDVEVFTASPQLEMHCGFLGYQAPALTCRLEGGKWEVLRLPLAEYAPILALGATPISFYLRDAPGATTVYFRKLSFLEDRALYISNMSASCDVIKARWREVAPLSGKQQSCLAALENFERQGSDLLNGGDAGLYAAGAIAADAASQLTDLHKKNYLDLLHSTGKAVEAMKLQCKKPEYGIAIESSMRKVFIEDGPFTGTFASDAQVYLAGNGHESFQIVILAQDKNLEAVRLEAEPLVSASGDILPVEDIAISPVGYVRCKQYDNPGDVPPPVDLTE